jgi:hypothetical protein
MVGKVAVIVLLLLSSALQAQTSPDSARAPALARQARRFCWQGTPIERCRTFALIEMTIHSHWIGTKLDPAVTRPLIGRSRWDDALASQFVGDLGAMMNIGPRSAVGGTLTAGSIEPGGKPVNVVGATVRYRRWLTPSVSADAGTGVLQMPVGIVGPGAIRKNVLRPALVADARLGFRDLVSATARFMEASDGLGRTHHALFVGASTGSKLTTALVATAVVWAVLFSPRGDKVYVQ